MAEPSKTGCERGAFDFDVPVPRLEPFPCSGMPTTVVSSSPASKMSPAVIVAIIVGGVVLLGIVCGLLHCCFRRNYSKKLKEGKGSCEREKIVLDIERGRMLFFEGKKGFELENLLAEMLLKGGFGQHIKT